MSIVGILIGGAIWGAILLPLHFAFTRKARRDIAAGAVFRGRMRRHVLRGGVWS